jgi:hypothetical protein
LVCECFFFNGFSLSESDTNSEKSHILKGS